MKVISGSSGTMLDHGCASGGTMLGWLEKGWNCKGLDPHKPSVEAGIKNGTGYQNRHWRVTAL